MNEIVYYDEDDVYIGTYDELLSVIIETIGNFEYEGAELTDEQYAMIEQKAHQQIIEMINQGTLIEKTAPVWHE